MAENKQIECTIKGKVQMVMFRDFVQRKARGLGLIGTVGNKQDGTVHVVAQGQEKDLERFIELLHKGPFLAHVSSVDVNWMEPSSDLTGFKILYT